MILLKKVNEIKGYEDMREFYYIDESGNVWSNARTKELKKLNLYTKTGGYLYACLMDKYKKKHYVRVHRLVALAYIPNLDNKAYVNHINENRTDNHVSNLEWVTPKENNLHSLTKKMYVYNSDGELFKVYDNTGQCKEDGFNQGHACSCARDEVTHHKNHVFSYKPLTKNQVVQRLSKPYNYFKL